MLIDYTHSVTSIDSLLHLSMRWQHNVTAKLHPAGHVAPRLAGAAGAKFTDLLHVNAGFLRFSIEQ
jgi:hypothetical protein